MASQSDIVKRLREGRTDGSDLRWTVTDIHREAAAEIERLRIIAADYNALQHRANEISDENERLRCAMHAGGISRIDEQSVKQPMNAARLAFELHDAAVEQSAGPLRDDTDPVQNDMGSWAPPVRKR